MLISHLTLLHFRIPTQSVHHITNSHICNSSVFSMVWWEQWQTDGKTVGLK